MSDCCESKIIFRVLASVDVIHVIGTSPSRDWNQSKASHSDQIIWHVSIVAGLAVLEQRINLHEALAEIKFPQMRQKHSQRF